MSQWKVKEFLKKYLFDILFYSYLIKLSFLTNNHTKAEIYIGTLLSFILICVKVIDMKENAFKKEIAALDNKVKAVANSLNSLVMRVERMKKGLDSYLTKSAFNSRKNPFDLNERN
jgi:stalled ribosome alternative rescue factor ArfA